MKRMMCLLLAVSFLFGQVACYTTKTMGQDFPGSYTPVSSEGNQCKNECIDPYNRCEQSSRYMDANGTNRTNTGKLQGCLYERDQCYERCAQYNGGEYQARTVESTQESIDWKRTGLVIGGVAVGLMIISVASALSAEDPEETVSTDDKNM